VKWLQEKSELEIEIKQNKMKYMLSNEKVEDTIAELKD